MADEFTIGDLKFRLEPMTIEEAELIYPNAVRIGVPVAEAMVDFESMVSRLSKSTPSEDSEAADGEAKASVHIEPELLTKIVGHLSKVANVATEIPVLRIAFMRKCKVRLPGGGNKYVPLETFFNETFQRKHGLMLRWLAHCVMTEFHSFLDEIALNLG